MMNVEVDTAKLDKEGHAATRTRDRGKHLSQNSAGRESVTPWLRIQRDTLRPDDAWRDQTGGLGS